MCFQYITLVDIPEKYKILMATIQMLIWLGSCVVYPATEEEPVQMLLKVALQKLST